MKMNTFREKATHTWTKDSTRLILTPSKEAKAAYFYIQEIGDFKTTFPYFLERESLNSFLIILTISGKGILEYKNKTYTLEKGHCCFINCMEYHKYYTMEQENWEFLWVHFNGANALGYFEIFTQNEYRILNLSTNTKVEGYIRELIAINQKKNLTTEIETSKSLHILVSELLIHNYNNEGSFLVPNYIKEIAKDMDRNFKEALPLSYFEEQYHRSKYHIAKEFKKYIGVTINEYLILNRISYAKELLKYTDASVHEITYEIGMNHVSHFINLFKEREHMTPLKFRQEWRE